MKTPLKNVISRKTAAASATAALTSILGQSPFAGVVSKIEFIPNAGITGDDTETRTFVVKNKGTAGIGTTVLATLAFSSGVTATAFVPKVLTLSGVSGARNVSPGDVIVVESADVGETGTADPGGRWNVEVTRNRS